MTAAGSAAGARADRSTAWHQPATVRSHAAYLQGALRWFAGGLAGLILAAGLSAYAVLVLGRPGLGVFIVAAALLGAIALAIGVGALLRAHRFRATLQQAPWQVAELRVVGAHLRLILGAKDSELDRTADSAELDGAVEGRTIDARLMTTSRWRVREVVGHRDGAVLICPAADGSYVLTAEGMNNLYGLRALARRVGRGRR